MKRKEPSGTEGEGQQGGKSFKSSINIEKSQKTATVRKAMHDAIVKGDLGEVKRCLEKNKDIRQWLDPATEKSALCKAAEEGRSKIRAYLVHRNCTINTEKKGEERVSFEQVKREKPLQDLEYRYQLCCMVPKCGFISHLVSRSSSKTGCDGFENKITKYYEALQKIAMVDTILQVAATTSWLNVIFDFQSKDLGCIMSHIRGTVWGVTLSREESIYLGAKREERDLLGTMAHEFSHFALNLVYGNDGKPYKREDEERRVRYQRILDEIRPRKHSVHSVIQRAFQNSSVEEQELVVRIPHVLAMQSERCGTSRAKGVVEATLGEKLLQKEVPLLYQFYKDFVIPDMEAFITKNRSGKDKEQIQQQNVRLRKAERARKLGIEFKTKYELRDEPLVVLTAPYLSYLEAKINDAVRLKGESYVLLDIKHWDSELKAALKTYKCHYVVLSSEPKYKMELTVQKEIQDLLKDLSDDRGTRVIVLIENAEQDQFAKGMRKCFTNNMEFTPVLNCSLDDVTVECKAEVLKFSSISFQNEAVVSIAKLMTSGGQETQTTGDIILKALDESAFLELCRYKKIDVGPKLQRLNENIGRYYVERTCERATKMDLHAALRKIANEAFAIMGICRKDLNNFLPPGCHACHHSAVKQFERCVLLGNANDYDALTRRTFYEDRTIHLLQYDSQRSEFHWVTSNGSVRHLMNVTSAAGEIRGTEALLHDVPDKVVAICGDPGMGKSVMSLRMAQDIKALDEIIWVLQVDLSTRIGTKHMNFPNTELITKRESLLAALCDMKEGTFEFNLLKSSISRSMPFRVVVMLDAFDEVDAENREHLIQLVLALSRSEISKILVFSRNCSKLALQDKFSTIAVEMIGFKENDQLKFLKKFWIRNDRQIDDQNLNSFAERCLSRFYTQRQLSIAANPLLLQMIAGINEPQLDQLELVNPEGQIYLLGEQTSTLDIYEKFVEIKFKIYQQKLAGGRHQNRMTAAGQDEEEDAKSSFFESHCLLGLKVIFNDEWLTLLLSDDALEKLEPAGKLMKRVGVGHLKHGLVDGLLNGIPVFLHRTFAEFFAAHFLGQKIMSARSTGNKVRKSAASLYGNDSYDGVLVFLDAMGARSHLLHRYVMCSDQQGVKNCAEQLYDHDNFSRSSLHIAAVHADEDVLDIIAGMQDGRMADELQREDQLGMTPLMYADRMRALQKLNVFCKLCSGRGINWAKQLPIATENITNERNFLDSVIREVIDRELHELLDRLLKARCVLKSANKQQVTTDPPEARYGQVAGTRVLVDVDSIICNARHAPIFHASSYETFRIMLPYSNIGAVGISGSTLLRAHAAVGSGDVCKYLLFHFQRDSSGVTSASPLIASMIYGNLDTVPVLVPHSETKSAHNGYAETPLHVKDYLLYNPWLCTGTEPCLIFLRKPWCMALKSKAMKEILPHVDVTIRNYDGNTVLHTIFDSISWKGLVTLFLPYSDVYAKNNDGETPLLLAASYLSAFDRDRDYVNDMKLLILHSPVNATDVEGRTALHRCADKGHLDAIKLLFPHSSANKLDKTGKSALHYALEGDEVDIVKLLLLNSSVAATDRMILRFSAQCDYINIARFLLRLASSSARDASARMPLNCCSPESGFDIVRLLPHLSASTVDEQGSTLLRISAKHGHVEVVQMILPHSDANIPDGNGDSALHVVACKRSLKRSKQDLAVVRLLFPYSKDYTQFHPLKYRDPVQKLLHLHSPVVS